MTKLSVNINKIATLRNARGGNIPDVVKAALDIERFGADGITVHPRPDERHITYNDVMELKQNINIEFNVEGNPKEQKFIDLVLSVKPHQVTLVPDAQGQLTSDHGWDTVKNKDFLKEIIGLFKKNNIRTSIFVNAVPITIGIKMVEGAKLTGTDRIELYTESFARDFYSDKAKAVKPFTDAAKRAGEIVASLLDENDFVLFEHPFSDKIGHEKNMDAAIADIKKIDEFLEGLLSSTDLSQHTILLTSDHGNFEDLSIDVHTMNLVPTIVWGKQREFFVSRISSLLDITPSIVSSF